MACSKWRGQTMISCRILCSSLSLYDWLPLVGISDPGGPFQACVLVHTLNSLAGFKTYALSIFLKVVEELSSLRG